jgi:glycosyltransferase involved in cell wall biosynthesis
VKPPTLAVVVPCFNEEQVLAHTCERLANQLDSLIGDGLVDAKSFICFVDDGSLDDTWGKIDAFSRESESICGLKLSRNFGHQNALLAGLLEINKRADCVISIDADLQQDENAMAEFVREYSRGADIVFGVRSDRHSDDTFKRVSADFFYRLMVVMGVRLKRNHADYRLMSKRAIEALREYDEDNLFLRGIVPQIGFKQSVVKFDVREREQGKSKYTLGRMISFALNGITSFSITPLRIVTTLGFLFTFFAVMMSVYILVMKLVYQTAVPGWASAVLPIYILGGIQLLSIGVIGEYVGRVYMESKRRPRYIIEASTLD